MVTCNTTLEEQYINEIDLWDGGLTFHHLFLIIAAAFGLISIIISLFLIFQHATHYSVPNEQKHIIRILFMIPIYSTVSFLSYLNYRHSIYYSVLGDCYEAFAIASFFTLLCNYIAPTLHEQKEYFRSVRPKNWFWSVFGLQKLTGGKTRGPLRIPRSGLTWFNIIYVSVFQYCFIRVLFTIVAVVSQAFGRYCDASVSPAFAHVWCEVFEALAVTIAMFCLVQFYIQLKDDLAHHRPFLKVLSIKLVIFFSFWQTFVISFLSSSNGPLQPSAKVAYSDIKIGIPSVLLCVEMAIFAVLHLFAFPWKEYTLRHQNAPFKAEPYAPHPTNTDNPEPFTYHGGRFGLKAIGQAFNPWDIIKASARGFRWLAIGRRNRFTDPSYAPPAETQTMAGELPGSEPAEEMKPFGRRERMEGDVAGLLANAGEARDPDATTAYAHEPRQPNDRESYDFENHAYKGVAGAQYQSVAMPTAEEYGGRDAKIGMAHSGGQGEWH